MTSGQIAALFFAILLLLPGGCFLAFGVSFVNHPPMGEFGIVLLTVGSIILALAGGLFWFAVSASRKTRNPKE